MYGSPIRVCEYCHNTFIDKDFIEIAISGIQPIDKKKVSPQAIAILVSGVFFFILSLYLLSEVWIFFPLALLMFGFSIYNIIDEYRGYEKRIVYLENESVESKKRLSNPQYALALKEIGYKVPSKYLPYSDESFKTPSSPVTKKKARETPTITLIVSKDIPEGVHTFKATHENGGFVKVEDEKFYVKESKKFKLKDGQTVKLINCEISQRK